MAKTLRGYLSKHKILSVVIGYFLFSVALNVVSGIDILIPCLWTKFFGLLPWLRYDNRPDTHDQF